MTKQVIFIPGKHPDGSKLELRIIKEKTEDTGIWIIYGVNKTKNEVLILHLFIQPEEPILNVDYVIDENPIAKDLIKHDI